MKKLYILAVLIAAILMSGFSGIAAENSVMIENGDFENGISGFGICYSSREDTVMPSLRESSTISKEGAALEFVPGETLNFATSNSPASKGFAYQGVYHKSAFNISEGIKYSVSADVYPSVSDVKMRFVLISNNRAVAASSEYDVPADRWNSLTFSYTPDEDIENVKVRLAFYNIKYGKSIYVDNLKCSEAIVGNSMWVPVNDEDISIEDGALSFTTASDTESAIKAVTDSSKYINGEVYGLTATVSTTADKAYVSFAVGGAHVDYIVKNGNSIKILLPFEAKAGEDATLTISALTKIASSLMLVDDKKSIIDGLEVLIDWNSLGYEIAAKTVSAKDAIEKAKKHEFDLIITDIRMPEMFGMELITEISSFSPKTKFIIVSAYSEFEYAKWAIDYQVSGYLLKPIDEEELIGLLQRLKAEFEKVEKYNRQNMVAYFANILSGDTSRTDKPETLDLKTDFRYISIREIRDSAGSGVRSESMEQIVAIIKNYNGNKDGCFIVRSGLSEIELIINEKTLSLTASAYVDGIKQRLLEAGINDFVIFAGEKVEAIKDINNSKNTIRILEDALFYIEDNVFFYEDYKDTVYTENISDNNIIQKIIDGINDQDEEVIKISVDVFHDIIVKERVKPEIVCGYINKIIFDMIDCFGDNGNEIIPIVYRWSVLRKNNHMTHEIVHSFLKEITEEFCDMLTNARNRRKMGVVGEIAEYLKRNYSNPELGLSWIAKKYFITPAYLGKMFKEKTGVSFNNYLLNIRIEKAKELLERTEYKVYEIAQMVGFVDSNYFHAKFQELENMSPSTYRKNKQQ